MGIPIPNIRETFMDLSEWRKRVHGLIRIGRNDLKLAMTLTPKDPNDPLERNYTFVLTAKGLLFTFQNQSQDWLVIEFSSSQLRVSFPQVTYELPPDALKEVELNFADPDSDLLWARQYLIEGLENMRLRTPVGDSGDSLSDLAAKIEEILGPDVVESLRATSTQPPI